MRTEMAERQKGYGPHVCWVEFTERNCENPRSRLKTTNVSSAHFHSARNLPGSNTPMRCPFCHSDNDGVRDSRLVEDGKAIRRRRFCNQCKRRFTTYERVEGLLQVRKRDGTSQDFSRAKIERGLALACWKRKIKPEEIHRLANEIEAHVLDTYEKEVTSEDIGNLCMEFLKELDQVAFVRFASVYRSFSDAQDFVKEITPILAPRPTPKRKKQS